MTTRNSHHEDLWTSDELVRFPKAASLRSAGQRLLGLGHHPPAELLIRACAAVKGEERVDVADNVVEDLARAVLSHSPIEADRILSLIERGEGTRGASTLNLRGRILYELCDFTNAEDTFGRAMRCAVEEDNELYKGYIHLNQAILHFDGGRIGSANKAIDRAMKIFEVRDDSVASMFARCNRAVYSMVVGNYDSALESIDELDDQVSEFGNPWLCAFYKFIMGEMEILLGDHQKALKLFQYSAKQSSIAGNPALHARALTWRRMLEGNEPPEVFLQDIEAIAHDLSANGLRSDSGLILILGTEYAGTKDVDNKRLRRGVRATFGSLPSIDYFSAHYQRLIKSITSGSINAPRRVMSNFITQSPKVMELLESVHKLSRTDVRLLFEGESGTGKSFVARLTHDVGGGKRPFVVVDCTNLEENLFESKLFGHTRGAFTGAVSDSVGLVEQANGGTLFLDEIGEMPVEIQAKLLYTIEEQRYRPVGARMEKTSQFRVIAATNRDIDEMLDEGTLRRDLYFRIAGYRVQLPPLRDRREDVIPLTELQLGRLNRKYGRKKSLRPGVWEALVRYDWPGNVRELNAVLERGFHLASGRRIAIEDLGLERDSMEGEDLSWDCIRRTHLLRVLRLCRGNVTQAAKLLRMNRTTLIYKLKQLDIERADFDPPEPGTSSEEAADKPSLRLVADRDTEKPRKERSDGAE